VERASAGEVRARAREREGVVPRLTVLIPHTGPDIVGSGEGWGGVGGDNQGTSDKRSDKNIPKSYSGVLVLSGNRIAW